MLSNTDRPTLHEPEAEAAITATEAEALDGEPPQRRAAIGGRIAKAAVVLMIGTILSRVLGLGRESTIAGLFGAGANVDAFTIANHVSVIVYDLLISGTVSAALVPVFSEYAAEGRDRREFSRVVSSMLTIAGLFLLVTVSLLELFAEPLVGYMGAGFSDETRALALTMTQWVLPGVFFMGLSGVVMATHYSLNRFVYPAVTSALFNAAIIFCAFTLAGVLGVRSLVVGMVVGALAMLAVQGWGLRDIRIRPTLDWSHPAVRKILMLYVPVGISMVISAGALIVDRNLASLTGEGSISAMRFATTLIQFALGLVSAAISLAALPSLSQHFSRGDSEAYKRTLAAGLRLVLVMVLPAAAGLFALAWPIASLFFQHGAYTVEDQRLTVLALLLYVPGLPFSAIDQVLIFAFYARKNTVTPVLVGIVGVAVYLAVASTTVGLMGLRGEVGMASLVVANSVQLSFHAIVTGALLWYALRREGGLRGYGIGETLLKAGAAAIATAILSYIVWQGIAQVVTGDDLVSKVLLLGVPVAAGGTLYAALVWRMRLPELQLVMDRVRARLKR